MYANNVILSLGICNLKGLSLGGQGKVPHWEDRLMRNHSYLLRSVRQRVVGVAAGSGLSEAPEALLVPGSWPSR